MLTFAVSVKLSLDCVSISLTISDKLVWSAWTATRTMIKRVSYFIFSVGVTV